MGVGVERHSLGDPITTYYYEHTHTLTQRLSTMLTGFPHWESEIFHQRGLRERAYG